MDIQQTLINIVCFIIIIGIIRIVIVKPKDLGDIFLKIFMIDLIQKLIEEMDFDDDIWED